MIEIKPIQINTISIGKEPAFTVLLSDGSIWHKNYRSNWYKLKDIPTVSTDSTTPTIVSKATSKPMKATTNRGAEWKEFSNTVLAHIENYTTKQYGDSPDDTVQDMTAEDCIKQVKKYAQRFGNNKRAGQDLLDMLKIAHYACLAHSKMKGN